MSTKNKNKKQKTKTKQHNKTSENPFGEEWKE